MAAEPFPQPAGAECAFLGRTRLEVHPEHGALVQLTYEAYVPLARRGHLVVCLNRDEAEKARTAAAEGMEWREILLNFGTDRENKANGGRLLVAENSQGAIRDALYATEEGALSPVFDLEDGKAAVLRCNSIDPRRQVELAEVEEEVTERMIQRRQEDSFQARLIEWKAEFGVVTYPERLKDLASWEELVAAGTTQ